MGNTQGLWLFKLWGGQLKSSCLFYPELSHTFDNKAAKEWKKCVELASSVMQHPPPDRLPRWGNWTAVRNHSIDLTSDSQLLFISWDMMLNLQEWWFQWLGYFLIQPTLYPWEERLHFIPWLIWFPRRFPFFQGLRGNDVGADEGGSFHTLPSLLAS